MRLTTSRYYTPSGVSIQATGVKPDLEVQQARLESIDTPQLRREADLRGSLDVEGEEGETSPPDGAPDDDFQDYQLTRALDLLQGLALFQQRAAESRLPFRGVH
jgi:carboxyl-terminal processing protease